MFELNFEEADGLGISNENINTGVSVVFKTKRELKCQNELFFEISFLWKHQCLFFHY